MEHNSLVVRCININSMQNPLELNKNYYIAWYNIYYNKELNIIFYRIDGKPYRKERFETILEIKE